MKSLNRPLSLAILLALWTAPTFAQTNGLDQAANELFAAGYPTPAAGQRLKDELVFQSAVQTYLLALPALNMYETAPEYEYAISVRAKRVISIRWRAREVGWKHQILARLFRGPIRGDQRHRTTRDL